MIMPPVTCRAVVLSLVLWQAQTADWPQWGGRDARNFVAEETGLPNSFRPDRKDVANGVATLVPGENLLWSAPLGTQAYVTPAVSQGRVFIGANDALVKTPRFSRTKGSVFDCLDEATGRRLWRLVIPRLKTRNKLFNFDDLDLGLCSSPTVEGNRVYVMGSRGDVLCLDINGQADGNEGPFTGEGQYMSDTRTFPDKPGRFGIADAPPLPAPVALQSGDADIVWRYDCNPPQNTFKDGRKLPYNKNGQGPSEIIATPVVANGRIYVAVGQDSRHGPGKGCLSCIDPAGEGDITEKGKVWQCADVDRSFSSAAVTRDGLVFIADYTGILRCLDGDTGKEYWSHDLKGRVFCSPLCADGKVYIGTEAGRLTVAAAAREKSILDEVRFNSPIYATPVAANGTLYIASQRRLYAFRHVQREK